MLNGRTTSAVRVSSFVSMLLPLSLLRFLLICLCRMGRLCVEINRIFLQIVLRCVPILLIGKIHARFLS